MGVFDRLNQEISTFFARLNFSFLGVGFGAGMRCFGVPIVSRTGGSTLRLGDGVVLTSRSAATALGVSRPVILRTLASGAELHVGDDTGMSGTVVCAAKRVSIGKRCLIGADCMIFDTDFHNPEVGGGELPYRRYARPDWERISAPVSIGDDVFLGARTIVCKGVTIGEGTIIGAGSVVTSDLPAHCIAAGTPARFVRWLKSASEEGR